MMLFVVGMSLALAKDGDEEACVGLADGDACVRADGSDGTCQPDTSDTSILVCDDDGSSGGGGSSSGSGCSTTSGLAAGWLALGLVAVGRRRSVA